MLSRGSLIPHLTQHFGSLFFLARGITPIFHLLAVPVHFLALVVFMSLFYTHLARAELFKFHMELIVAEF